MICSLSTTLLTFCVTIEQKEKKRWNKNVERPSPIYAHCLYQQHNRANDLFPTQRLPAPAKCLSTIDPPQNDLPACVFPILSFMLYLKPWVLYGLNAYFSARGPFNGLSLLLVSLIPCNFAIACNYRKTRTFNLLNAYFSARGPLDGVCLLVL